MTLHYNHKDTKKDNLKKVERDRATLSVKRRFQFRNKEAFVNHKFNWIRAGGENFKVIK